MKMNNQKWTRLLLAAGMLLSVTATGCTKYPTEEELNLLEMQKQAADDAEAKVADLENEKARLERELEAAKKELADHEAEFEEIKKRKAAQ